MFNTYKYAIKLKLNPKFLLFLFILYVKIKSYTKQNKNIALSFYILCKLRLIR